jgi:hypothetical protein
VRIGTRNLKIAAHVCRIHNPTGTAPVVYPEAGDFFAVTKYSEDYLMDGQTVWLTFWHRPLHAMTDAFCHHRVPRHHPR